MQKGHSVGQETFQLILDKEADFEYFRRASDEYRPLITSAPTREGLSELNISGSTQFSEKGLYQLKNLIPSKNLIVVDLRRESHGFINGMPVSWASNTIRPNIDKYFDEIQIIEDTLLRQSMLNKVLILSVIKKESGSKQIYPIPFLPNGIISESELCKRENLGYVRIPVDDHMRPIDSEVDRFITLFSNLPPDTWLHFHCKGGSGRTTTFMIMSDMMKNAKKVSLDDIITRQWLIGKIHLADCSKSDSRFEEEYSDRLGFLKEFYSYCQANIDQFQTSWSDWLAQH
jgi:hypothetical protein